MGPFPMGKVRARSDSGKLFLDFYYQGERCRELTALSDTPGNRIKVQKLLKRIEEEISQGRFDYAATFPRSPRALQFSGLGGNSRVTVSRGPVGLQSADSDRTPRFSEFAETWVREMEPEWRASYQ